MVNREKSTLDLANAAEGLNMIISSGADTLQKKHLEGILRAHGTKPSGNKPELLLQVQSLLNEKSSGGANMQATITEMIRLVKMAEAAAHLNDCPLEARAPAAASATAPTAAPEAAEPA